MDTFLDSCLFSLLLLPLHFNFLCSCSHLVFNFPSSPSLSFLFHHLPLHHALPPFSSLPFILPFFSLQIQREFWKRENEWVGGEGWVSIRAAASSFHVVTNITQRLTGGKIHWLNINKRSWDLDRLPYPQSDTGKIPHSPPPVIKETRNCCDLWPLMNLSIPSHFTPVFFFFFFRKVYFMMEDNLLEFPFRKSNFRHPSVDVDCKCTMFNIFVVYKYFLLNVLIQLVFSCCCDLQIIQVQKMISFHDVDTLDHFPCVSSLNLHLKISILLKQNSNFELYCILQG